MTAIRWIQVENKQLAISKNISKYYIKISRDYQLLKKYHIRLLISKELSEC